MILGGKKEREETKQNVKFQINKLCKKSHYEKKAVNCHKYVVCFLNTPCTWRNSLVFIHGSF